MKGLSILLLFAIGTFALRTNNHDSLNSDFIQTRLTTSAHQNGYITPNHELDQGEHYVTSHSQTGAPDHELAPQDESTFDAGATLDAIENGDDPSADGSYIKQEPTGAGEGEVDLADGAGEGDFDGEYLEFDLDDEEEPVDWEPEEWQVPEGWTVPDGWAPEDWDGETYDVDELPEFEPSDWEVPEEWEPEEWEVPEEWDWEVPEDWEPQEDYDDEEIEDLVEEAIEEDRNVVNAELTDIDDETITVEVTTQETPEEIQTTADETIEDETSAEIVESIIEDLDTIEAAEVTEIEGETFTITVNTTPGDGEGEAGAGEENYAPPDHELKRPTHEEDHTVYHNSVSPDHDIDYTNSYQADSDEYFDEMLDTGEDISGAEENAFVEVEDRAEEDKSGEGEDIAEEDMSSEGEDIAEEDMTGEGDDIAEEDMSGAGEVKYGAPDHELKRSTHQEDHTVDHNSVSPDRDIDYTDSYEADLD